jgi:rhomboid protease GluP
MWENWRQKDYIEGEYEVIEERDWTDESYYQSRSNSSFQVDNSRTFITYIFLAINVCMYILMNLIGILFGWDQGQQLLIFGAKVNILIAYGQYWRLLTAMFLHIGLAHLFFNTYALYIYGPIVERLFGKYKFPVVYLVSGLTGSLLSYMFSSNHSAGASGAIFGLMGALLYFGQRRKDIFRRVFGSNLFIIIGFNLLYGFMNSGIDNWGHIGGLIGGYFTAYAVGLYREPILEPKKILVWVSLFLLFYFGFQYGGSKYRIYREPLLPGRHETIRTEYRAVNRLEPEISAYEAFEVYDVNVI